jgi:hypothetical protein
MTYDHIINFGREIRCIWSWPLSVLSIAFLMNRYCSVVANVLEIYLYFISSTLTSEVRYAFITDNDTHIHIQRSSAFAFFIKFVV